MDYLSLNKINNLFWLGRYQARVDTTLAYMSRYYDKMIDGTPMPYEAFCAKLSIPCVYKSNVLFVRNYIYNAKDPFSIRSAAESMLGNGMVLRETIGSTTLSYLQMAVYALDRASVSTSPSLGWQKVADFLMAFLGSCDSYIENQAIRDIVKSGICVEHLSLYLRLGAADNLIEKEIHKLLTYTERATMPMNEVALNVIKVAEDDFATHRELAIAKGKLLTAVESLFRV